MRPKWYHVVTEPSRAILEIGSSIAVSPLYRHLPQGDGHTVITLPGFMGADGSTSHLRTFLNDRGYNAKPWGLGRHGAGVDSTCVDEAMAFRIKTEENVLQLIEKEFDESGQKVSLVGWSLGGLVSTSLAHRYPQWIRRVITLGTPYGDPRATVVYGVASRFIEAAVTEEDVERWVSHTYQGELKVPILALYSKMDGIVGHSVAQCRGGFPYVRNVSVMASHLGFPFNPIVRTIIARELAGVTAWQ